MRVDMPAHRRLALLGVAGVILAMVAALVAFNAFEMWQVRRETEASLEEALGWEEGDSPVASRVVEYLMLDEDYQIVQEEYARLFTTDYELAEWCKENLVVGVTQRAVLSDATCYVRAQSARRVGKKAHQSDGGGVLVAYVDVTAQQELVLMVNVVFVAIALLGSVVAGYAGHRVGRRLEEVEEARARFYQNVSHELKTPLAAIGGYAEGMAAGVVDSAHAAAAIVRESRRMNGLVGEMLDLSRLEAGAVSLSLAPVEVEDLVQDCLMPFEGQVRKRGIDVDLELAPGTVRVDADLMGHALENVLANAVRHAATVVRVSFDGRELVVENDGDVPTAENLAHLFDRFYTTSSAGTGIGLALAREIVELHGWHIGAEVANGRMRVVIRE